MGTFSGKRVIISGGSRGIGLAIGKRLAADGACIAILAKTTEPHPKLPGTIFTAAAETRSRRRPGIADRHRYPGRGAGQGGGGAGC